MDSIIVKSSMMSSAVSKQNSLSSDLYRLADEIGNVQRSLSFNVKSRAQISSQLVILEKVCSNNAVKTKKLSSALNDAIAHYTACENRVAGNPNPGAGSKKKGVINPKIDISSIKDIFDWIKKQLINNPHIVIPIIGIISPVNGIIAGFLSTILNGGKPVIKGAKEVKGKVFGLPAALGVSGELFGYSGKVTGKAKWDLEKKEAGIKFGAEGEAHVAQGSLKGSLGILSSEVKGTVGEVKAKGEVGVSLYKDGRLSPGIEANLEAKATGLKGEVEHKLGNDEFNIHGKGEGSLGVAKAEASGGLGAFTYTDDYGNSVHTVGAHGKLGAEACAAEGRVSGGFNVFGIKIDVGITGKAGAVGASAEGRITGSGAHGKIGGALILGGGLDISIDWSGLFK